MFLYIKDYFVSKKFYIILVIFCSFLILNSIMTLIDLKNYEVVVDSNLSYRQITIQDERKQLTIERPKVNVKYKFERMNYKFTWVSGQLLEKNYRIETYTLKYEVYCDDEIDEFTEFCDKTVYAAEPIIKEYENKVVNGVCANVIKYKIKFDARVYLPHIFIIVCGLFFIVPLMVIIYKIKKEENRENIFYGTIHS